MRKTSVLRKNLLRSLVFYFFDMAVVTCGFIYGYGLEVKSWPVVIGLLLFSRWFFHIMLQAFMYDDVKRQIKDEEAAQ